MNKKLLVSIVSSSIAIVPLTTLAGAFNPDPAPVRITNFNLNTIIGNLLGFAWPIIVVSVIVLFIAIAFEFINAGGEPAKVGQARLHLIWAMVGVVLILLSFSIVAIVRTAIPGV